MERRDRSARREMARTMRMFASGRLSVDEFEEIAEGLSERDSAVFEAQLFCWHFYSDFGTDRPMRKGAVTGETRELWAKWILFLMTSEEQYEGPDMAPDLRTCLPFIPIWISCFFWPLYGFMAFVAYYLLLWTHLPERLFRRPEKPPAHWPFPAAASYNRSVALSNPFVSS